MVRDFGNSIGFANTIKQNNVGGGTIESIDVVPIACIRNVVANNDKEQDIGVPNSEDIERRLSYDERPEEGDEFCSKDKHLISKEADGKSSQHIAKGVDADCLNEIVCGLFVLKFMTSIMEGESIEKCVIGDIPRFKKNSAANLWRHSMCKIEFNYETLDEKGNDKYGDQEISCAF
ncbi:hypothetical protein HAX54_038419 [Datura stramonium]|uniref:Uncharacterized protein n=1 Tax=Datura stramonium TaxID=4076 RepID=A0ABS8VMR7_DATST|nr:hypothetical protein [Datura stramonium]